jgi:signal transduction histidine kinase/phage shock protein PspC (stress-responsive transcriptional regulator)
MESAASSPRRGAPPTIRRDPERALIAGVCSGIARYFGIDPIWPRLAFVVTTLAGGFGVVVYLLGWGFMPTEAGVAPRTRRAPGRRGSIEVGLGAGFLLLALLLALRASGLWFSDTIVWPLVLVGAGAALLWRQSMTGSPQTDTALRTADGGRRTEPEAETTARMSRTGLGIALVIAAGIVFLKTTGSLSAARDVVLAVLVVAVGLSVIFAPLIARMGRSLAAERAERIRSQERAEMAAHLHDSVLQTLALMQKRADDPREVAALARRQERELRSWLSGRGEAAQDGRRLASALEAAADEIEREHGVPIDVVAVGDAPLGEPGKAAVAAAREAMLNASKFGGGSPVDVYAEADDNRIQIFVRDRGPGFDPASIPGDRRGVRESIVGRMERHGGSATIRTPEGGGTEVELLVEAKDR